jgi:nicotinamidase-related amidase
MLNTQKCCLIVVDVQGKLAQLMHNKEVLFKNIQILLKSAKLLSIPILWIQQKPEALGETLPEIAELLTDNSPVNKVSFSACGQQEFITKLNSLKRSQVLLCGIETHVCVYQTAMDLLEKECEIDVISDAVSSRTLENKQIALQRLESEGANISSTEMALFELLRTADHTQFKEIAKLIK